MRKGCLFTSFAAAAVGFTLTLGAGQARAQCQVQWEPDPFGDSGGSLGIICNDPSAPTGSVGASGPKKKKKRKPPPSHASIAVNLTDLNNGDLSFSGAFSAGYKTKREAIRKSERACRRAAPGSDCESLVTARNGWAAIVATLTPAGQLVVFGGSAKRYESAFQEAEERARDAFGGTAPHEIQRVRGVRSRAR
jgi:hypothetical protein